MAASLPAALRNSRPAEGGRSAAARGRAGLDLRKAAGSHHPWDL